MPPKGLALCLFEKASVWSPVNHGADHENGLRGGTENTSYIVALGKAAYLASQSLDKEGERMSELRDHLEAFLVQGIGSGLKINGGAINRLPNTLSVSFPGVTSEDLLARIPELCASTGAACHSSIGSATLKAMGLTREQAAGTVRLSLGWHTSEEEIERAGSLLVDAWENAHVSTTQ